MIMLHRKSIIKMNIEPIQVNARKHQLKIFNFIITNSLDDHHTTQIVVRELSAHLASIANQIGRFIKLLSFQMEFKCNELVDKCLLPYMNFFTFNFCVAIFLHSLIFHHFIQHLWAKLHYYINQNFWLIKILSKKKYFFLQNSFVTILGMISFVLKCIN